MAFQGMDVGQVQNLGNQLKNQAGQIDQIVNHINSLAAELQAAWKGKDAQDFDGWWQQQHRPALQHAAEAIRGLGQSALNNATEQQNVSNH